MYTSQTQFLMAQTKKKNAIVADSGQPVFFLTRSSYRTSSKNCFEKLLQKKTIQIPIRRSQRNQNILLLFSSCFLQQTTDDRRPDVQNRNEKHSSSSATLVRAHNYQHTTQNMLPTVQLPGVPNIVDNDICCPPGRTPVSPRALPGCRSVNASIHCV